MTFSYPITHSAGQSVYPDGTQSYLCALSSDDHFYLKRKQSALCIDIIVLHSPWFTISLYLSKYIGCFCDLRTEMSTVCILSNHMYNTMWYILVIEYRNRERKRMLMLPSYCFETVRTKILIIFFWALYPESSTHLSSNIYVGTSIMSFLKEVIWDHWWYSSYLVARSSECSSTSKLDFKEIIIFFPIVEKAYYKRAFVSHASNNICMIEKINLIRKVISILLNNISHMNNEGS